MMRNNSHKETAEFIWKVCDLLRGNYKRNEYRKVILPLVVLCRFDALLKESKQRVLYEYSKLKGKPEKVIIAALRPITGFSFYNTSKMEMKQLLDDPNHLAQNFGSYINGFSPNIREIMDRFRFEEHIDRMNEKDILYMVLKKFTSGEIDFSPGRISNEDMGYVFEELIRIGAEQANEEAGEHFTPREIIKLMVYILLSPRVTTFKDKVKKVYDPACGTGGMLSMADEYMCRLDNTVSPHLFGQDMNDEAWAVCMSDMLIKGYDEPQIVLGDSFRKDGFREERFDYMLANPPFGVSLENQRTFIENEAETLGFNGRFGAGTPRINDGSLLFLQHMLSKMYDPHDITQNGGDGSRIAVVFNGSPLFNGDAGSGESEIRRWIIENDWLEAVIALPDQLFYNTGISTYLWILSNNKEARRRGKVQLVDAREYWHRQKPSLNNKRKFIPNGDFRSSDDYITRIAEIYDSFIDGKTDTVRNGDGITKTVTVSKIFPNEYFGYYKITVERPLRLSFCVNSKNIARLDDENGFKALAVSKKKAASERLEEEAAGRARQAEIKEFLAAFGLKTEEKVFLDRKDFLQSMRSFDKEYGIKLTAAELKAVLAALSERDENAQPCTLASGELEPDTELRDYERVRLDGRVTAFKKDVNYERVSLLADIDDYFEREVRPHVPDAWIDPKKTKIGYEIPFTREFYVYKQTRDIDEIEAEINALKHKIAELL